MLTGLLPFQAVIRNHATDLPTPSELNHALPAAVDPVILRAINVDPAKRFRTAREFADALNTALAQQVPEPETDNDIWTVPTISVGAGLAPAQGPAPTPASPINANVIVRTIIPDNPCGNCGRANRSTSHFCRHCGHGLGETSPLVTDVCQVGYLSAMGQQAHDNEDTLLIVQGLCNTLQPPPRPFSLFAVADGQGQAPLLEGPLEQTTGVQDVAGLAPVSRLAIETITDVLLPLLSTSTVTQSLPGTPVGAGFTPTSTSYNSRLQPTKQTDDERIEQWLRNAVRQANQVIYHCNADYDTTMASTLASIILYKRRLYLANVGNSRAYCYNEKMGLQQIGNSSNNRHRAQTPVEASTEASVTPATSVQEQISNPLAGEDTINHYLGQQYQVAIELFKRDVEVDDLILLCTDGLWHILDDEHIQKILASGGDIQRLAHTLVEAANSAGGTDNISAIVVRVQ
jgi:serine/threonine protein phosphatase PrpC